MKKRTIISLGICALAIGAIAGVIGTQKALEVKADVAAGWYLTGLGNKWTPAESIKSDATPQEGYAYTWTNVSITQYDSFKLAYAEANADSFSDWKGMSDVTSFPTGAFKDYGGNIGAELGGIYDVHLTSDSKIVIEKAVVVESWGLVGSQNSWTETSASTFTYDGVNHVYTLEYEATVDEEFKIRANGKWASEGSIELWWQFVDKLGNTSKLDKGSNAQFKVAKTFIFTIKDTITLGIANDYTRVGNYIDISIKGELADGYYLVGLGNDWTKNSAIASQTLTDGNKYQKTNIEITHGDEFKIVAIKDNAIDWDDRIVAAPAKGESGNDQSANFVTVNDHEGAISLKAVGGGTFDIYVNSSSVIYVFGTKTERNAATEVDQFIDDFIDPNVTIPDAQGKYATWESCSDKYNSAKNALDSLSAEAQALFLTDLGVSEKIMNARASYVWWQEHKDAGENAKFIAPLSAKNPAIITIVSVVTVGVAAAAAMFIVSRKRRLQK